MQKRDAAFNSVIVLTLTMLAVKVLSAIYRVPYQNILGDAGLYAYQQVYPLAAIVSVLSLNAVPSVISGQQSAYFAAQVRKLLLYISLPASVILYLSSHQISLWMGDVHLESMLKVSVLALLPLSFVASVRGVLQSHNEMNTIAVSQMIDQILRVSMIMFGIYWFTRGASIYDSGVISILGSFVGLTGAMIYLKLRGPRLERSVRMLKGKSLERFFVMTGFFALSYLIMILWQLVDSFTVLNSLKTSMPIDVARTQKGIYDRGASLIQMGLIVTTSFSLVLIPLLAKAKEEGKTQLMNDYARTSLKMTIIFSSGAAVGLFNLIRPFNLFLFKDTSASLTLGIYMFAIIFVSLTMMYTAMLQITERFKIQAMGVACGLAVKIILNLLLIAKLGVLGAAIATVAGLAVYALTLHMQIRRDYELGLKSFTYKWLMTLLIMTIVLQLLILIPVESRLGALGLSLIGVAAGFMIVAAALIKFKIISVDELHYLPFGDKFVSLMKE